MKNTPREPGCGRVVSRGCLFIAKALAYVLIALFQIEWYLINALVFFIIGMFVPGSYESWRDGVGNKVIDIVSDTMRSLVDSWFDIFRD